MKDFASKEGDSNVNDQGGGQGRGRGRSYIGSGRGRRKGFQGRRGDQVRGRGGSPRYDKRDK